MVQPPGRRNPVPGVAMITSLFEMQPRLVECTPSDHGAEILAILNDAIATSTALYDYVPRPASSMTGWFEAKRQGGFPVWGALDEHDQLLGFATYGTFRPQPAYKYTAEHSVYVRHDARGRGVGSALMRRLIESATAQDLHLLVGVIDAENRESIAFHERLGFTHAGTIEQAGFKFGRWLDAAFYRLLLATPREPRDG